jgi:exodeoxyribonuclease-5
MTDRFETAIARVTAAYKAQREQEKATSVPTKLVLPDDDKPRIILPSSSITLTREQESVVKQIRYWWNHLRFQQLVFTVAGYAGVGKSTVLKQAIESLGLKPNDVQYMTYTGKAALVLTNKGTPAETIHKTIYVPITEKYTCPHTGRQKERVKGFKLRTPDTIPWRLFVVDEVSMVSRKVLADLLSLGTPVLLLGDPEQLPPVKDRMNPFLQKPDAVLTQVHRQAADNPILWASMQVRQGYQLPYGVYSPQFRVIPYNYLMQSDLQHADQIICGLNRTKDHLNGVMRQMLGFEGLPKKGDKLINRKNDWEERSTNGGLPLINGWHCRVLKDVPSRDVDRHERTLYLSVQGWEDTQHEFRELVCSLDWFEPQDEVKPDNHNPHYNLEYGYAITCHKSQGSEWKRVIYIYEPFGDQNTRRQLLYTGITRAADELVLVQ